MVSTNPCSIFLLGPTGVGKTELVLRLNQILPISVINADSAQVYRGMDIGTAKVTPAEQRVCPHALIDIRDPLETYSVAAFLEDVEPLVTTIWASGKVPVFVGGTALYLKALQNGLTRLPQTDLALRQALQLLLNRSDTRTLHQLLKGVDPKTAAALNERDVQRILRALEVYLTTQKPLSAWWADSPKGYRLPGHILTFAVRPESREALLKRLEIRFDAMLRAGLEEEVRALRERGDLHLDLPSMRAINYRQCWRYLDGQYDYETMKQHALVAMRQLAKRQMTWLRQWEGLHWLPGEDLARAVTLVESHFWRSCFQKKLILNRPNGSVCHAVNPP